MKKSQLKDMRFGMPSGKHEDMNDVVQGWNKRIEELEEHNQEIRKSQKGHIHTTHKTKGSLLPHEKDPEFSYGMTTHDIDVKSDPFLRSNAVIEQRIARQEAEEKRREEREKELKTVPKRKIDPARPTAASIGHTYKAPGEPALKDTFKMKRFTQFEHGKIDTGLRK